MRNYKMGNLSNLPEKGRGLFDKPDLSDDLLLNDYISETKKGLFYNIADLDGDHPAGAVLLNTYNIKPGSNNGDTGSDEDGADGDDDYGDESGPDDPYRQAKIDWRVTVEALKYIGDYLSEWGLNEDRVRIIIAGYLESKGDPRIAIEKIIKRFYLEDLITDEELDRMLDELCKRGLIGRKAYEALKAHAKYLKGRKRRSLGLPVKEEQAVEEKESLKMR